MTSSFFERIGSILIMLNIECRYIAGNKSIFYHTSNLAASQIILIFAQKFIMSDYGAERYNETTQGDTLPDPTGSCGDGASRACHN